MSSIWSKLVNLAGNITGTLPVANGGTALTATGSANQVLGTNSGASGLEYKTLAVGTTGSDFAVANAANSVTFNLPDAGSGARGAVTTGTQTLAGAKTLSGALTLGSTVTQSISAPHSYVASFTQTSGANADDNGVFIACATTGCKAFRIDTTAVNTPLIVNGNGQINVWTGNWGTGGTAVGVSSATLTLSPSSLRYKQSIRALSDEIDSASIYDLSGVVFEYKIDLRKSFGYIAEHVAKTLPCLVHCEPDETGAMQPESVRYDLVSVLIVEELKKLRDRIDALEAR